MVEEMTPPSLEPRPGVGNAYTNGWRRLWKNFLDLLLAGIVYFAIRFVIGVIVGVIFAVGWRDSIPSSFDVFSAFGATTTFAWHLQVVSSILDVFFFTPLLYGLLFLFLRAASGRRVDLPDLFLGFKRHYPQVLLASVLWWLIFSLVPFVTNWIPGSLDALATTLTVFWAIVAIVLVCRLVFVPFLLIDKQLPATEAFATSWSWSRGHALENFLIFLLGIPIVIGGLIVFIVGVIPAIMWIVTAIASQYYAVSLEKENPVVYPSPMVP
jgi:hypothetical protein